MFDNRSVENFRSDLQKLLDTYGITNNLEVSVGKISYAPEYMNVSIKVWTKDVLGGDFDGKKAEFERSSRVFGIPSDWYGKTIVVKGLSYIITGVNTRARKYPIIITGSDGTSLKITMESVEKLIQS